MKSLRVAWRGASFAFLCGVFYALWILGLPLAWISGRWDPWRSWIFHTWGKCVMRVLCIDVEVQGKAPVAPFLLVSNHLGYVDILLLASVARCAFVSKSEIASWPVIGLLARSMGTVFLDRTRKRDVPRVATEIQRCYERGQGIVFFPEGTSTPGVDVGPFRSSLLEPAAKAGLPVRHATLRYETPAGDMPAHLSVSWWGDMEFAPHFLNLLALTRIQACVIFGDEPIQDADRKRLAAELHRRVSSRFIPMTDSQNVCLPTGT